MGGTAIHESSALVQSLTYTCLDLHLGKPLFLYVLAVSFAVLLCVCVFVCFGALLCVCVIVVPLGCVSFVALSSLDS